MSKQHSTSPDLSFVEYFLTRRVVLNFNSDGGSGGRVFGDQAFPPEGGTTNSFPEPLPNGDFEGAITRQQIATFLMFEGKAEEAMNLYVSLFADSAVNSVSRYAENEDGPAGSVRHAVFTLNGQQFMCIDSPIKHGFGFTPSMSLYAAFGSEGELDKAYAALSEGGQVMMPLGSYPFSKKYAWLSDKYGVSWQLSLADA